MKGRLFTSLSVLMILAIALPVTVVSAGNPSPPSLTTLEPGGFRTIEQDLAINVVFVGYEPGSGDMDIDETAFLDELPSMYRTVNRFPSFYFGIQFLGLDFNYDFNLVYTDSTFEDAFFGYLGSIADPMSLTLYQDLYNTQTARSLDVTDNHWIDAPSWSNGWRTTQRPCWASIHNSTRSFSSTGMAAPISSSTYIPKPTSLIRIQALILAKSSIPASSLPGAGLRLMMKKAAWDPCTESGSMTCQQAPKAGRTTGM